MKIWKSGSDVMGIWKKQPYPTVLNKWDIHGEHVICNEPVESSSDTWIPPSEDPYYQKKWAYWKGLFAKES